MMVREEPPRGDSAPARNLLGDFMASYKQHLRDIYRCLKSESVVDTKSALSSFWRVMPEEHLALLTHPSVVVRVAQYDKTFYRSVIWALLCNPFEYERGLEAKAYMEIASEFCSWTKRAMTSRLPEDSDIVTSRLQVARLFSITLYKKAGVCCYGYLLLSKAHSSYWNSASLEDVACGRLGTSASARLRMDFSQLRIEDVMAKASSTTASTSSTATTSSSLGGLSPSLDLLKSLYMDMDQLLHDSSDLSHWACWVCNMLVSPVLPEPVMSERYSSVGTDLSSAYGFHLVWKSTTIAMLMALEEHKAETLGLFKLFFAWLSSIMTYFLEYRQACQMRSRLNKMHRDQHGSALAGSSTSSSTSTQAGGPAGGVDTETSSNGGARSMISPMGATIEAAQTTPTLSSSSSSSSSASHPPPPPAASMGSSTTTSSMSRERTSIPTHVAADGNPSQALSSEHVMVSDQDGGDELSFPGLSESVNASLSSTIPDASTIRRWHSSYRV